ncbi:MAG: biotin--[acetyl-CoA-carboxylase] ligase [Planctomycetota bacterium]
MSGGSGNLHRQHFASIDSTNAAAAAWANRHPQGSAVLTATTQTAGRGQWGRDWQSPEGGAWFSLVLRRNQPDELISLEAAKAIIVALSRWVPADRLSLKPPNDVLLDERKVAGILCEQAVRAESSEAASETPVTLIVGVGINVNVDVAQLGPDLRRPAIALRDVVGQDVSINEVIDASVEALIARLDPDTA